MRTELRTGSLLAGLLFLASCASPAVRRLDQPVAGSADTAILLNPRKFTDGTRAVLAEHGLAATYRKNPAEAISRLHGELPPDGAGAQRLAVAELCSDTGARLSKTEPRKAIGYFLASAESTFEGALEDAGKADSPFSALYNHSTGQVAKIFFDLGDTQEKAAAFQGPWKTYRLQHQMEGGSITPDYFDELEFADYIELENYEMERYRRKGIGAAMIAHRKGTPERREKNPFLSPIGMTVPLNVTSDFRRGGDEVKLRISDLSSHDEIIVRGRSLPLAADLTVSIAVQVEYDAYRNDGFKAMTHPDEYVGHTGLYLLEPFRPDKIPVIFVHGLMSEPEIWVQALNRLRADPVLAKNYQLLVYRYPTGFPVIYNIATLKKQLEAFQKQFDPRRRNPKMRRMVLVGHSLGSVISNSVIRGSGDAFTEYLFDRPIDELVGFDNGQRAMLEDLLIFDSNSDITRAVFLAGPFRGSKKATGAIGALGRRLIKLPGVLLKARPLKGLLGVGEMTEEGRSLLTHQPNGISGLEPGAPVLECILKTPVRKGLTVHTIIGREELKKPLEESSDGTVAYTSSHLDEAVSAKVVHAKHTPLCKHPDTLEELRRILYLHAGLGDPR